MIAEFKSVLDDSVAIGAGATAAKTSEALKEAPYPVDPFITLLILLHVAHE